MVVREDIPVGTVLDLPYPLATDEDEGDNGRLQYELVGAEGFAIDKGNGSVTTTRPLDFEAQRAHSLAIKVSDGEHEVFGAVSLRSLDQDILL